MDKWVEVETALENASATWEKFLLTAAEVAERQTVDMLLEIKKDLIKEKAADLGAAITDGDITAIQAGEDFNKFVTLQ